MKTKLRLNQVHFTYGQHEILHNLSFSVNQGEFISFIGHSGIGKSTLFQLTSGLIEPSEGQILLDGQPSTKRLGKVAYMPQQDLLLPWRTVLENALLPLEIQGVPNDQARKKVLEQLPHFGLESYADAYPEELSGGMRQRVSLLRATLTGSSLLLLDEPFSALDGITRMEMQEWLLGMWRKIGCTVMMITHDLDEAILLSDRIMVLTDRPITEIWEVPVPIDRQMRSGLRNDPSFMQIKEKLWRKLRYTQQEMSEVQ
ncbi:ABC transporter ATP-binding protein [Brevibacillus sp. SYSU BS000544]|uniref:ABC transporter ATP-binding protein n=1 Tax=Brevibacillus sp. SYSU BS000544 TaxID=3416443 RepID=UPI003CE59C35